MVYAVIGFALLLAFVNGANDNFKGVATLYGARQVGYSRALWWATLWTAAGSIVSLFIAGEQVALFQGKGYLPAGLAFDASVATSALGGAGLTVLLATRFGIPVSTTHALVGGMLGVAMAAGAGADPVSALTKMGLPLLFSPLIAMVAALAFYPLATSLRRTTGIRKESCWCMVDGRGEIVSPVYHEAHGASLASNMALPRLVSGATEECVETYGGQVLRMEADRLQRFLHGISGGAVCFSRAVNDTPKLAATAMSDTHALLGVTVAMVGGGLVWSRRVAETMSHKITDIGPGKGLVGNLVTALLVTVASRFGVPVSTTHVSVGAIFGIGVSNGKADWKLIGGILLAWVTTLPLAATFSAFLFQMLTVH